MNQMIRLVVTGLIILTLGLLPGCKTVERTLEKVVNGKNANISQEVYGQREQQKDGGSIKPRVEGVKPKVGVKGQIVLAGSNDSTQEKISVVLYFSSPGEDHLIKEVRQLTKVPGLAKATLNQLIAGPAQGSKLGNPIPKGTVLREINVKPEGLAIVNFSKELKVNHPGGSGGESMTVYAIVNTLTQFEAIKKVQILIEGEKVESLAGHISINQPLERDSNLIKSE